MHCVGDGCVWPASGVVMCLRRMDPRSAIMKLVLLVSCAHVHDHVTHAVSGVGNTFNCIFVFLK
jgi:hypothetical protein